MKNKKNIRLIVIFFIVTIIIICFFFIKYLMSNTYVVDENKYNYAFFLKNDNNKNYNISFIIPKDYKYEKFDGDDVEEVYSKMLIAKGGDMDGFTTSACIYVEYFLTKENNTILSEFPESRVEGFYDNYIELNNIPKNIIKVKLLSKNYLYFMEKEHLFFIETDKYLMCLSIDLPYEYSTDEEIIEYFTELLKSLKIKEEL